MNRSEYRKARALIRANGMYALQWLTPAHAALMFLIHRAPGDMLAQRMDVARVERSYANPNASRFAFMVTQSVTSHIQWLRASLHRFDMECQPVRDASGAIVAYAIDAKRHPD